MIKSCATIALVPTIKSGPWIYWDDLEKSMAHASLLGFDAIELFTASSDALDVATIKNLLEKYQLQLAAVGTGAGKVLHGLTLTDPDELIRKKAILFIENMISFGAYFNAPAIIGSMQGNIAIGFNHEQSLQWLAEGLIFLGKHAASLGVQLIYEPLNRYETNLMNTLSNGAQFLKTYQINHVGLLADLFHMNIEEVDIAASIRAHADFILHVHFADSNRRPVGNGHTNFKEIAKALKEINYQGYISAEAFPWPSPQEAASQTIDSFKQLFKN
jgi:sugar phosphate isomerase/epimerase